MADPIYSPDTNRDGHVTQQEAVDYLRLKVDMPLVNAELTEDHGLAGIKGTAERQALALGEVIGTTPKRLRADIKKAEAQYGVSIEMPTDAQLNEIHREGMRDAAEISIMKHTVMGDIDRAGAGIEKAMQSPDAAKIVTGFAAPLFDKDGDGKISPAEQADYTKTVTTLLASAQKEPQMQKYVPLLRNVAGANLQEALNHPEVAEEALTSDLSKIDQWAKENIRSAPGQEVARLGKLALAGAEGPQSDDFKSLNISPPADKSLLTPGMQQAFDDLVKLAPTLMPSLNYGDHPVGQPVPAQSSPAKPAILASVTPDR